uniref:Uncharacterized protein n=1 Tax=Anguilla anguilla TaxID=7936 RepID=A0A0E9XHH4_ANGAN
MKTNIFFVVFHGTYSEHG